MGEDYGAEEEIVFEANNIRVTLLEEQTYDHYIVRQLELENVQASFLMLNFIEHGFFTAHYYLKCQ